MLNINADYNFNLYDFHVERLYSFFTSISACGFNPFPEYPKSHLIKPLLVQRNTVNTGSYCRINIIVNII